MRNCLRKQTAFTLIEVTLVMTYMALLASIIIPRFSGVQRRAREVALRATLHELRHAVESYHAETGAYPLTLDDLVATEAPPIGLNRNGSHAVIIPADWRGPYIRGAGGQVPKDPVTTYRTWYYKTSPPFVGLVRSMANGRDLDGVPYSSY